MQSNRRVSSLSFAFPSSHFSVTLSLPQLRTKSPLALSLAAASVPGCCCIAEASLQRDERRRQPGGAATRKTICESSERSSRTATMSALDQSFVLSNAASLSIPHSQHIRSFSQGTEIVIRAATGSLAQMRHVVGQFPLVRKSFFLRSRQRSRSSTSFCSFSTSTTLVDLLALARSRSLFRAPSVLISEGAGARSADTDRGTHRRRFCYFYFRPLPPRLNRRRRRFLLFPSRPLLALSLAFSPSCFPPLRREREAPMLMDVVVVAAFALFIFPTHNRFPPPPHPPPSLSLKTQKTKLSPLRSHSRARLPSARGRPPLVPLLLLPLPLPRLGASQRARTPRRCPLRHRSRSTGGPS